jgi:hypothetical protein
MAVKGLEQDLAESHRGLADGLHRTEERPADGIRMPGRS